MNKAEARLALIEAVRDYAPSERRRGGLDDRRLREWLDAYNEGALIPEVYGVLGTISRTTVYRWHARYRRGDGDITRRPGPARGTTRALTAAHQEYILGVLAKRPHTRPARLHEYLQVRYRDYNACESTVRRFVRAWRGRHRQLAEYLANPDAWRSRYETAQGDASEIAEYYLHIVEFDTTPADILCADRRRYQIIAAVDVYSRRAWALVTRRSTAAALASLWRRIILEAGIFDVAIMDNGQEYRSRRIMAAADSLLVDVPPLPPFRPDLKPHVERFFRTLATGLFEELEGFIGHNVAERRALEARDTFAARLGRRDEVIACTLSPEDLQATIDDWIRHVYHRRPHRALGVSPEERAAQSARPIRTIPNERALDILLAPAGDRTVGKSGIRYDGGRFVAVELADCVGYRVSIREDVADASRLYVFALEPHTGVGPGGEPVERNEGDFICVARDAALEGLTPEEAARARRLQRRLIRQEAGALATLASGVGDPMGEFLRAKRGEPGQVIAFRRREVADDLPALAAAETAAAETAAAETDNYVVERSADPTAEPIFDWPHERYRWLVAQAAEGHPLTAEERHWMENYENSDDYYTLYGDEREVSG